MKKVIRNTVTGLLLGLLVSVGSDAFAQGAPPPPPNGGHGQSGDLPAGGDAPIGGGLAILLVLGAAYAGKKAYDAHKEDK